MRTGSPGFGGTAEATGLGDDMKRSQIEKPKPRREPAWDWDELLPLDLRDRDIRRAKALARAARTADAAGR